MEITLQYFEGCPNWTIASERLAAIVLDNLDITVTCRPVETVEDAEAIGFRGSPSILVNGVDLFPDPSAPVGLACRIYVTPDGFTGAPTLEQLQATIRAR
ncbi:thioredoxin family protein [Glaciihabitans sp. UYNi722]|uniref:thioredoxin family protein n=1 Tax=Glaciihabitans sp. UYNi722 TaxID=3156344 RepID=UPI00339B797F